MHKIGFWMLGIAVVVASMTVLGQAPRAPRVERGAAPTDKAAFFFAKDLRADVAGQVAKNVSNSIGLMNGRHFSLNMVHRVGSEQPQRHKEEVDLYLNIHFPGRWPATK